MEDINFSALAPRYGSRPMIGPWSDIGTSSMSGGAISWGNIWNNIKSFGSSIKNWGNRAWNSNAATALKKKLHDTDLTGKIVDGLATGIHGAVDLANQAVNKQITNRLDKKPIDPDEIEPEEVEEIKKKPREDEIIIHTEGPPAYETLYPDKGGNPTTLELKPTDHIPSKKPRPLPTPRPFPTAPIAPEVVPPPAMEVGPSVGTSRGWQGALNNIVGVGAPICGKRLSGAGVRFAKRRRCY
ncbi:pVI [bottlenose dolphin adenovirus 2]|uniref:PVI n=1 Tax=bottlenose dolphin adenovirus 2 TaxID=2849592 RepID=A0A0M4M227_9ADEN|nr:pVI [Bottlenose dolphin adenovirus 1]ALE15303.1 pVI [Bottlenose dolphin adenovirus 1]